MPFNFLKFEHCKDEMQQVIKMGTLSGCSQQPVIMTLYHNTLITLCQTLFQRPITHANHLLVRGHHLRQRQTLEQYHLMMRGKRRLLLLSRLVV